MSTVLLGVALVLFAVSIALLIADVWAQPDMSGATKWAWTGALVVLSFFTAVLWFAQGRTRRAGRIGSVLMVLAIFVSIGVIGIEAVRAF